MNLDTLLDYLEVEIYDYDVESLLQQHIFELNEKRTSFDIWTFVGFFISITKEKGIDAVSLVKSLIKLYQKIQRIAGTQNIKPSHITDYLVQTNSSSQHINQKDQDVEILGLNKKMLRRLNADCKIIDLKGKIIQAIPANDNELFILGQFSETIYYYRGFTKIKDIGKSQPGNFVSEIYYSKSQRRLGAIMRDFHLIFWEKSDEFNYQLTIKNLIQINQIRHLQLQDIWLTTNKLNQIQIWDLGLGESEILTNNVFTHGIESMVEMIDQKKTLILSSSDWISIWDMYDRKFLYKFQTSHQKLRQFIYSQQFQLLFTIGFDNYISAYQLHKQYNDQNEMAQFRGHETTITCIELILNTALLLSIDTKNLLILWDIRTQEQVQSIQLQTRIMTKSLFKYGQFVCILTNKLQVLEFEVEKKVSQNRPVQVLYDPWAQRNIIITRLDIRIQNIIDGNILYILGDFNEELSAGCLINQGNLIILGNNHGSLMKVQLTDGSIMERWDNMFQNEIMNITIDETANILHVMSMDSTLKSISLVHLNVRKDELKHKDKRALRQLIHNNTVNLVCMSVYHGLLATSFDDYLQIWNLEYYSVVIQIQLEEETQISGMLFCDKLPLLIISTSSGDIYFLQVHQNNEHYLCSIEGQVNIVKATLQKKLGYQKKERKSFTNILFELTQTDLKKIYENKDQDCNIQVQKLYKGFKISSNGTFVSQMAIKKCQGSTFLFAGTNHGIIHKYNIDQLIVKETIYKVDDIHMKNNHNSYRVIYNEFDDHFIENYKIVQGRLIKDHQYKSNMRNQQSKVKQKFRMGMVRLSILKSLKQIDDQEDSQDMDPVCNFDENLEIFCKIHDSQILQLSTLDVDPYQQLFQQDKQYIMTLGSDLSIKIITFDLEILCQLNLKNQTPTKWIQMNDGANESRAQIMFALNLIEKMQQVIPIELQINYSIEQISKELLSKSLKYYSAHSTRNHQVIEYSSKREPPQLKQVLSLRYFNEKHKIQKQIQAQKTQEKQNEMIQLKRSKLQKREEEKRKKKEITDFFHVEPKNDEENKKDMKPKPDRNTDEEKEKEVNLPPPKLKTERNTASKLLRTTNFSENSKRIQTDSTRQSLDFFEYASSKLLDKTYSKNQFARTQHKQFHQIINSLDGKLKLYKGK